MGILIKGSANRATVEPSIAKWAVIMLGTLALFAVVTSLVTLRLRHRIQLQISHRDAEVLSAVAVGLGVAAERAGEPMMDLDDAFAWLPALLETSELRGVLGMRIFDPIGLFVAGLPENLASVNLPLEPLLALHSLQPAAVLDKAADLGRATTGTSSGVKVPLLTVLIPLHRPGEDRLLAVAEYLIDGRGMVEEFTEVDLQLARQTGLVFALGGALYLGIGFLAFFLLRKSRTLLHERTSRLKRVNLELALMAKTSALGGVTGHLIHGLKNPLWALETHLRGDSEDTEDRRDALESVARMRGQLQDLIDFLRDEQHGNGYELSLAEIKELLWQKTSARAKAQGVDLCLEVAGEAALPGHMANLAVLILLNLLDNAIRVSQPGNSVFLTMEEAGSAVVFRVEDEATGLSDEVKERLFVPCRSETGGSGLGLALSSQLARQAGGDLALEKSDGKGTVFRLTLPLPRQELSGDSK